MRAILAVLSVSALVLSVFATTATVESLHQISSTKFGKTLLDTIQVELRSHTGADPRPKLLELLREIREATLTAISDATATNTDYQNQCTQTQSQLTDTIKTLNDQIKADQEEKDDKEDKVAALKSQRDIEQNLVDGYKQQLTDATLTRESNQKLFEERDQKFKEIIRVLDTTLNFIQERLDARSAVSFLEKSNVLIEVRDTVTSPDFQSISVGWGQLISFIATKALDKLKQDPDSEARKGLQDIVALITQVSGSTNNDRIANELANNDEKNQYAEEKSKLDNLIAVGSAEVASLDTQISNLNSRVTELQTAIDSNNVLILERTRELNNSQRDCKEAQESYEALVATRNSELQVIDEVLAIVENDLSNLREYTENQITQSEIAL